MGSKRTFVVGRRTRRSTLVVVVDPAELAFPGPWVLRAVVAPTEAAPG